MRRICDIIIYITDGELVPMNQKLYETVSLSAEETEKAGKELALLIELNKLPRFVALFGGLGAGKTAFTRGFCAHFCPSAAVRSPSFAIVNEYRGNTNVFHFDVWRITDDDDLYSTGFYDYLERDGVVVCEWAENIEYALPEKYIKVTIEGNGDVPRKIIAEIIN